MAWDVGLGLNEGRTEGRKSGKILKGRGDGEFIFGQFRANNVLF